MGLTASAPFTTLLRNSLISKMLHKSSGCRAGQVVGRFQIGGTPPDTLTAALFPRNSNQSARKETPAPARTHKKMATVEIAGRPRRLFGHMRNASKKEVFPPRWAAPPTTPTWIWLPGRGKMLTMRLRGNCRSTGSVRSWYLSPFPRKRAREVAATCEIANITAPTAARGKRMHQSSFPHKDS